MTDKSNQLTPEQQNQQRLRVLDELFSFAPSAEGIQKSLLIALRGYLESAVADEDVFSNSKDLVAEDIYLVCGLLDHIFKPDLIESVFDLRGSFVRIAEPINVESNG